MENKIYDFLVSFPGLGINDLKINSTAFTVFGIDIAWYGIIVTLGIISACLYCWWRLKKKNILNDDFLDLAIFVVIFGIVGARLFYVLTSLDQYHSFWDIINLRNGGLAIYGGVIGGVTAGLLVLRHKKMNAPLVLDALGPACMLGQLIGRWGNFANGECYGSAEKFVFLGKQFDISDISFSNPFIMNIQRGSELIIVQPTFLYESVWNLIGFILINIYYKKKKYDIQVFIWYLVWYGFGRAVIEGLRTDSLMLGPFKVSQLIGVLCFAFGVVLLIVLKAKKYDRLRPLYSEKEIAENDDN